MKRTVRNISSLLLAIVMILSLNITALASGTVTYEGNSRKFIFEPGSEYSPTDLFPDFKEVMPGDSISQEILIKNNAADNVTVKIYLRALGAGEGSEEFLSKLKLRVTSGEDQELFDAPADETAQLTDWVEIGTFYSGAEVTLHVTLDVPIELGNEYQDAIGYLDWQFKVEEFPIEPDVPEPTPTPEAAKQPETPKTGDTANPYPYIALLGVCGFVLMAVIVYRRRKTSASAEETTAE